MGSSPLREVFEATELDREKDRTNEKKFRDRTDQVAKTTVIWKHIYQVWLERNLARHGKEEEEKREKERLQCTNEISTYYTYRDEGKLLQADSVSAMFYASIQELLRKESTLHQVDT